MNIGTLKASSGRKGRELFHPLRLALTGRDSGPEMAGLVERMGKDRSTVTNYIRLLKLPPDIQVAVRNGDISMGHARALINVVLPAPICP